MIRIENDMLTVRLNSEGKSRELTGQILPCPAPTCPCSLVFLSLAPQDRPAKRESYCVDVKTRTPAPLQGPLLRRRRTARVSKEIAALFRDEHWKTLERLLREGRKNPRTLESMTGAAGPVILVQERQPRRNGPCNCGSGKKYKKCCGQSPSVWVAGG